MDDLVVRAVDTLSEQQLTCLQEIYEGAFSPDLRVPFRELTRPSHADQTFVAIDGKAAVGLAVLRLLDSVEWSFLRYFAIAGDRRSKGLGRQFWQLLQQSLRKEGWPPCTIFEVEDPDESAQDEAERLVRERRIRFWTMCGARLLPVSGYVLPDYTGCGSTEPVLLMAATPAAVSAVRGDRLRNLVRAIYMDRYRLAPDDPVVSRALTSILS